MKVATLLFLSLFASSAAAQSVALMAIDASEDCSPLNVFEAADLASTISIYEVQAGRGNVSLRDVRFVSTLKGTAPANGRFPSGGRTTYYRGARLLVFVDDAGRALAGCSTVDSTPDALARIGGNEAALVAAIQGFVASRGSARRALLVDSATSGASFEAAEAADALSSAPALVASLTPAERAQLVAALATPIRQNEPAQSSARIPAIASTLARLHAIEAVPGILRWFGDAHVNPRLVEDALELLTNHHDPAYIPGRDPSLADVSPLRARWQEFYEAHRNQSPSALVAAGFAERGLRAGAAPDRAILAQIVRAGPDRLTRLVAAERCERVRGAAFGLGIEYRNMGDAEYTWMPIASACEAP